MNSSNNAPDQSMKPAAKRVVDPVELPRRPCTSPDSGDAAYDVLRNRPLSERGSQSARTRTQRQGSVRASSHLRRYSHPAGVAMPGYHPPSFYHQTPQSVRTAHPYSSGESGDYSSSAGFAAAWQGGMAPMPVFGPWGYEMGWGPHPSAAAGMYGVCIVGAAQSRRSEKPTRIVFVGGLPPSLDETKIQELAEKYGPIRGLDTTQRESSSGVFVSYYDVRHAQAAVKNLPDVVVGHAMAGSRDGQTPRGVAYFMLPPIGVPGMENQGIIAVHGGEEISSAELKALFAKQGDLKSVSKGGSNGECRVVEFFDTREAESAMAELKGRKLPTGLKLEYAPFAGLEPPFNQSYQMYTHSPGYFAPNGLKHEDSGIAGGLDTTSGGPGPAVWPLGVQHPAPYGWAPYPIPAHHGSFGSDGATSPGTSTATPSSGPSVELPCGLGDASAGTYLVPHNCRTDYYTPQYMGYPHGMPAMMPYGPAGQPVAMMQAPGIYEGLTNGMRSDLPNSPIHGSSGSEAQAWRPHRTGRGCGERSYDPAQFEFNLDEAHTKSANARTTLMIRNIPNKYSQKMLLDVLDRKYRGRYDFFYLPIDFKNRCNLGYAFVNFKDAATTAEFYKELHSKSWEEFNSKKVCEITYARVQGRNALIEHFRNSRFPCNEPDYLPLVFEPIDEGSQNKTSNQPAMKATPVHHWTNLHYPHNPAVAAH